MLKKAFSFILITAIFLFVNIYSVNAETSHYRSAGWVTTDGNPAFVNTDGCQVSNDGLYCSRVQANSFANLYFSSFGNLADFNIPAGSAITKVHIRVKGKNSHGQYVSVNAANNLKPFLSQCQIPADMWTVFLGSIDTVKEFHTSTSGNGLTNCITASNIDQQKLTFRLNFSSPSAWSAETDNLEVAFDYDPPTITPTPSVLLIATDYKKPISVDCSASTGTVTNCDVNRLLNQDNLSISWISSDYEEIKTSYESFNIPENAVIKAFQWQVRAKASSNGWSFFPSFSIDNGQNWLGYAQCTINSFAPNPFPCVFNTSTSYVNSTLYAKPHSSVVITPQSLNDGTFRFKWYQSIATKNVDIDFFQLKVIYELPQSTPIPTQTPSPTPTPTPSVSPIPTPFLDLPWDYRNNRNHPGRQELSFNDAASAINSYFDHTYPFLSADLPEPALTNGLLENYSPRNQVTTFKNVIGNFSYTTHDGYDYGKNAQVYDGDPVYAAADGIATVKYEEHSGGAGNIIKITHEGGYQTWYEHLYKEDLVVKSESGSEEVKRGDPIGKVGHTGNCYVEDINGNRTYNTPACAHIHFTVVQDKTEPEGFSDNIPDGMTDPYGWMPHLDNTTIQKDVDPWEVATFKQNGLDKTGNKSNYLWMFKLASMQTVLTPELSSSIAAGNFKLDFPQNSVASNTTVIVNTAPKVETKINGKKMKSVGPSLEANSYDVFGSLQTLFLNFYTLTVDFTQTALFNIKPDTLSIYSSQDMNSWNKEETTVDLQNKKASTKLKHMTYFVLMGEVDDTIAPVTSNQLIGTKGESNIFRSDVNLSLNAGDNDGGVGIKNTFYKLNDLDWQIYTQPLTFTEEGAYEVHYYSDDSADNVEDVKILHFSIDKTAPVTTATVSGTEGEDGWLVSDALVTLSAVDNGEVDRVEYSLDGETYLKYDEPFVLSSEGSSEVLYRAVDKAGNVEEAKSVEVKIDKIAPASLVYTTGEFGKNGWFRSDVSVALNANDAGSGFSKSYFSYDGETFGEYLDPLKISTEGTTKIYYYSVDKAGNEEVKKLYTVKIDKTAPEAEILYDIPALDIKVKGKDNFAGGLITNSLYSGTTGTVTIEDTAGNSLKVIVKDKEKGKNARLSVLSLQYNDGNVVTVDKNTLSVKYDYFDVTTNTIKKFDQDWKINDISKLTLSYSQDNDLTTIKNRLADGTVITSQVVGKKFLKVTTDKGSLVSSY